ncbi:hypothetical protein [Pacificoceanicola onchidii]|uniref:hypothetical protein n=1 Tax=Pacificoceanicola onchidii TaxID=2562685 RepID=UPI001F0D84AF|nr:hypothetical protein [Pacificoceanicola onchidii]
MSDDFLAPEPLLPRQVLDSWADLARSGAGSPWLEAHEAEALARHALVTHEGVALMEAVTKQFREPVDEIGWEIVGADDPGDNWADHADPSRAMDLLRRKIQMARRNGVRLLYKIWLKPAGAAG